MSLCFPLLYPHNKHHSKQNSVIALVFSKDPTCSILCKQNICIIEYLFISNLFNDADHIFLCSYLSPTLEGGSYTVPEAVVTVLCIPDDGCGWHPKHVKWTCRIINALLFVASRWAIISMKNFCCNMRSIFFNNTLNGSYSWHRIMVLWWNDTDRAKRNRSKAWPNATSSIINPPPPQK